MFGFNWFGQSEANQPTVESPESPEPKNLFLTTQYFPNIEYTPDGKLIAQKVKTRFIQLINIPTFLEQEKIEQLQITEDQREVTRSFHIFMQALKLFAEQMDKINNVLYRFLIDFFNKKTKEMQFMFQDQEIPFFSIQFTDPDSPDSAYRPFAVMIIETADGTYYLDLFVKNPPVFQIAKPNLSEEPGYELTPSKDQSYHNWIGGKYKPKNGNQSYPLLIPGSPGSQDLEISQATKLDTALQKALAALRLCFQRVEDFQKGQLLNPAEESAAVPTPEFL